MEVAKETVAQMVDDESEVISIYYGADTEEAEAEELATALEEAYPELCSGCAWEQKPDKREKDTRHNKKSEIKFLNSII
ncbi:hypothetical protein [Barnesiella intestinihominis]|uniref:hypothetical protein n=1 Tax=Barnesiella intestinihominis TaxID=487174 RepID=UPI003AB2B696